MKNAAEMAVNEINEKGGINGKIKIQLLAEDDEGIPANAVNVVQKLVEQDKVNIILGAQLSSCTLAMMEITKAAKIPQITPASSNVTITQQGNKYIYRMTSTDATNAKTLLKYCQSLGYKKIAMCYDSGDFGTGGFKIVSGLVSDYGIEIVDSEVYNAGDTDFAVILSKMDAAKPDPVVQAFDKKYRALYKDSYDQNGPQSYDAVYLMADAVKRAIADGADWKNGEILNKYIASASYTGATGTTAFDETGDMIKDLMLITVKNGVH